MDRVDLLRAVEQVAVLDLAGAIIANPQRAMCSLADRLALAYATENFWAIALEAEVLARAVERSADPEQLFAQAGRVNALMAEHRSSGPVRPRNMSGSACATMPRTSSRRSRSTWRRCEGAAMTPIAAIHVAKGELGLDDDTYRALLKRVTGKTSSREMTPAEQNAVLDQMRIKGFRPVSGSVRFKGVKKGLEGRFARKLQAMWIAAWNLGVVEDCRDSALIKFVKRQTNIDHVRFLHDPAEADKVIEAIKGWTARAAGVDWSTGKHLANWMRVPGARIAVAQWQLLAKAGVMSSDIREFRLMVRDLAKPVDTMQAGDWLPVMNTLGERVRKISKG